MNVSWAAPAMLAASADPGRQPGERRPDGSTGRQPAAIFIGQACLELADGHGRSACGRNRVIWPAPMVGPNLIDFSRPVGALPEQHDIPTDV